MITRLLIRFVITAITFVPFFLHSAGLMQLGFVERMEHFAYDMRLLLTMPQSLDDRIVIVDIDERSLAEEGQWPWARDRLARMVDKLFDQYEVKLVAFDIFFAEPDRGSGLNILQELAVGDFSDDPRFSARVADLRPELDWDQRFAASLKGRDTVLGYVFRSDDETRSVGVLPSPSLRQDEHQTQIDFMRPQGHTGNLAVLQGAARAGGFIDNPNVDADGSYRRVPVLQQVDGDLYESLALAATRLALGSPPIEFVFQAGSNMKRDSLHLDWIELGEYRVPLDEQANVLVPYRGRQGSFPYVPATDVVNGRAPKYPLQGAIVLVGTSAAGLHDMRVTPVAERYNGVEVHANIISGILDQTILNNPAYARGIEWTILLLTAVFVTIIMARLPVVTATLGLLLFMSVMIALNLKLWQRADLVVPIAPTLMFAFCLYLFHLMLGYFSETRIRHQLSDRFGEYVPPELVREMGTNPGSFSMESDSREMTVMFSDVRGFTGISETLEPRELSLLMNEFLTPMTRVIHRHRGTIDKYMGDAIMAFWGAPIDDPDHARNALLASMEMQGALRDMLPEFRSRGWPDIRIGIGLNTGIMRVGDMGSEFRKAYTVMGDSVNLGARLESLTKHYGVPIAVGRQTAEAVPEYAFLELDLVRVKGKDEPAAIYEPLGSHADLDGSLARMLNLHKASLRAFRSQDWDRAESGFFQLHQAYDQRQVFQIYLDRIAHFRAHPPDPDWDGVFTHSVK